ncbi:MAG: glycosyltransferase family 39 protein [bacterium]|nr:glycosyltransferase family 39 protein [bacterium]
MAYVFGGGPSDWAARLPSVVAGVAGALALVRLLRGILGLEAAFFGGAVLALIPVYLWMAQSAEPEMLFVATGVLAMMCFGEAAFRGGRAAGWRWGLWLLAGLSFLTKGPVMPGIVLLTVALWALLTWVAGRRAPLRLWLPASLAIVLAPTLLWGLMLWLHRVGIGATIHEALSHVDEDAPHKKGFFYYFDELKVSVFPWALWLLAGLLAGLAAAWRAGGRRWSGAWRAAWRYLVEAGEGRPGGSRLFLVLWFAVSILVLSAIPSKRYYYALILTPPAAALCALIYCDWAASARPALAAWLDSHRAFGWAMAAVGIILVGVGLALKAPEEWNAYSGEASLNDNLFAIWVGLWLAGAGVLASARALAARRAFILRHLMRWTLALTIVTAGFYQIVLHPRMNGRYSLKTAAAAIAARVPPGAPLFAVGASHTIWFYLGRPDVPVMDSAAQLHDYLAAHPGAWGVVYEKYKTQVDRVGRARVLYRTDYIPVERCRVYLFTMPRLYPSPLPPVKEDDGD